MVRWHWDSLIASSRSRRASCRSACKESASASAMACAARAGAAAASLASLCMRTAAAHSVCVTQAGSASPRAWLGLG